jgi:uncharacterized protein YyaL (SSP411 family)
LEANVNYFIDLYQKNPAALNEHAAKITRGIHAIEIVPFNKAAARFTFNDLNTNFNNIQSKIDYKKGGQKRVPKFPMPFLWEYLLYYHYLSKNEEALGAVTTTRNQNADKYSQ